MASIVVTRNYQMTLPKDIREELNIRVGDRMIAKKEDDTIIIKKIEGSPVEKAFGIWKGKFKKSSVEIVNDMRKEWDRY